MTPFALISLNGGPAKAGLVAAYDVQRSLFSPAGSCELEIAAGADFAAAIGDRIDLWLGDLSAGASGLRWPVFAGRVYELDTRPLLRLVAGDPGRALAETTIAEPRAAIRQPLQYWVEWAALLLPLERRPALDLDLPPAVPKTRTNEGLFGIVRKKDESRDTTLAELLVRAAERYRAYQYLGEHRLYHFRRHNDLDGVMVWKPWVAPAADRHRIVYGENLVAFEKGFEEIIAASPRIDVNTLADPNVEDERQPHRWEILPAPWIELGDTFAWVERAEEARLPSGRFRIDSLRHYRRQGTTRTEIYSRWRVA